MAVTELTLPYFFSFVHYLWERNLEMRQDIPEDKTKAAL